MRLSREPRVKYSPSEQAMFSLLSTHFISSNDLIERWINEWYDGAKNAPYYARKVMNGTIGSLAVKMEINGEPMRVERTPHRPSKIRLTRVARRDKPGAEKRAQASA